MDNLTIVKVGGKIVEEKDSLNKFLDDFSTIEGFKILVHGGGRSATSIASRLGIESKMINGRRITDSAMLEVVTMVYGGLVNKNIVAGLQSREINALGLTGADMDIIRSAKRPAKEIDYGFAGDIKHVNISLLSELIHKNITPVLAPLTHDGYGNMLNTNADTIASEIAIAFSRTFDTTLIYCFEKKGVLSNEHDENSVIPVITAETFQDLITENIIKEGMIPKLENSFSAINSGVSKVIITSSSDIKGISGTIIKK